MFGSLRPNGLNYIYMTYVFFSSAFTPKTKKSLLVQWPKLIRIGNSWNFFRDKERLHGPCEQFLGGHSFPKLPIKKKHLICPTPDAQANFRGAAMDLNDDARCYDLASPAGFVLLGVSLGHGVYQLLM